MTVNGLWHLPTLLYLPRIRLQHKIGISYVAAFHSGPLTRLSSAFPNVSTTGSQPALDTAAKETNGKATLGGKAQSFVSSLLHGSSRAREEEQNTYSKVLARGKYVHELSSNKLPCP